MSELDHLPFPSYAHVPGQNVRPNTDIFLPVVAMAITPTADATAQYNIAWHYGIKLINHGFYWEAHEVLETLWMKAIPNSRERHLLQGVIHLANCALKVRMGRTNAALRLSDLAAACIMRSFEQRDHSLMGLQMQELLLAANEASAPATISNAVNIKMYFD